MEVKQLSKNTPANVIKIRMPIWGGGKRAVGIATFKVGTHNQIEIEHKNADGSLLYPEPFYISGEKLRQFPVEAVKKAPHIKLYIVPIDELQLLERI